MIRARLARWAMLRWLRHQTRWNRAVYTAAWYLCYPTRRQQRAATTYYRQLLDDIQGGLLPPEHMARRIARAGLPKEE